MILADAKVITEKYMAILAPYCKRIEVAGSVRRECAQVGDIDIVCIRKGSALAEFAYTVNKWTKVKGEPTGKYTSRMLPDQAVKLELWMVTPENWGLMYAIRTGSAEFSHFVLATSWVKAGYNSKDGYLFTRDGQKIAVREERELFHIIGVPFVPPKERNL